MTTALQIKLLAAILAVLGVMAGLIIRGGRPLEVMSAQPVPVAKQPLKDDHEQQYRRFVEPTKKRTLIP